MTLKSDFRSKIKQLSFQPDMPKTSQVLRVNLLPFLHHQKIPSRTATSSEMTIGILRVWWRVLGKGTRISNTIQPSGFLNTVIFLLRHVRRCLFAWVFSFRFSPASSETILLTGWLNKNPSTPALAPFIRQRRKKKPLHPELTLSPC